MNQNELIRRFMEFDFDEYDNPIQAGKAEARVGRLMHDGILIAFWHRGVLFQNTDHLWNSRNNDFLSTSTHKEETAMKTQETRFKEATERALQRATRSASEQVYLLDARLGKGIGAKKERARLMKLIEKGE